MVEVLEKGNLFVLYRPKVDSGADSVQRLYLLLASESRFRLFIVGANALPADESRSEPDARHWALVRAVSDDAGEIASILRGGEYETETEGTRHLPPAAPVGEGRYALAKFDDDAQLVFELDRFEEGGLTREIRLERKGFLIVAVRNPEVDVEGFPDSEPGYPEGLRRLFRGRRWIGAVHPGLLNHAGAQLALIRGFEVDPSESGLDEVEDRRLEEFVDLDLPRGALDTGEAPDQDEFDRRHHAPLPGGFPEGSRSGGRAAAKSSDAASAISSLLAGLSFPASREEVLEAARDNRDRLDDAGPALERLEALPDGEYDSPADIQQALSDEESERRACPHCGREFDTPSELRRHEQTAHPRQAPSVADLEYALRGVSFPAGVDALKRCAEENGADDEVLDALDDLPDRAFRDAAEVAEAFQEAVTGIDRSGGPAPSERAAASTSAAGLASALQGIDLPADRDALRAHAEAAGAPDALLERIEAMPDREYSDFAEIEKGFGEA